MSSYLLTPAAEEDIFEIWRFIASDNPFAANQLESDIFEACQRIAQHPDAGHFRKDLTKRSVRFLQVRRNYLIVYDPDATPVVIVRILHGARNAVAELKTDLPN